jgi:hypothetical protein
MDSWRKKRKEEEERWRRQGRRGLNQKRKNKEDGEPWTQEGTTTERGGGVGRGSEEAISTREEGRANPGYWNPRRGRGEKCKNKGGYPDKARKNHVNVQDYSQEMIRMQGLCAMTRTRWQCIPLWRRQQQKNKNVDYVYVVEWWGDQHQMGIWLAYADNNEDHGLPQRR